MKLVILVDCVESEFKDLIELLKNEKIRLFMDTRNCDEVEEFEYITSELFVFSQLTEEEIMLINFSGKESVVRELGDKFSEMIVSLSEDKNSIYYTESLKETLLKTIDLIKNFEKEQEKWH